MVAVMQQVVRLDESSSFTAEQKIAQLESENRTLRELLSVSKQFASSVRPAAASNPFYPSGSSNTSPEIGSPIVNNCSDEMFEGKGGSSHDNGSASANYNPNTVKKRPSPGEPPSPPMRPQNSTSEPTGGLFNGVKLNGPDMKTEPSNNSLTGNSGFGHVNGSVNFSLSSTSNTNNNNYQFINNDDPKSGSYECLRNGPNKVLVVSAPMDGVHGGVSDSSATDGAMMNHNGSGSSCSINNEGGYGLMYRQPSDNDIVSDTDSDSSSSNASTVTLTPCTSDREDDEPCPMVPDSLMISTPPDVVAAVTPFSKSVANCLTNGCIGDYHSTAAPSQNPLDAETPVIASAGGPNLTNGIP